jgi:hypothetical protein
MSTGGPSGSWSDHSSDVGLNLTGDPTTPIPIELSNGSLINSLSNGNWNAVPATGSSNATSIPDIYPFASGYGLFAGDCPAEDSTNGPGSATALTAPGVTATTPATTVPLAVLPLQVNSSSGAPEAGDTLTLTPNTPNCSTSHTYPLQPTGPDGFSRTEVPFGLYTLTVKSGSNSKTFSISVAPGSITVVSTVYSLPSTPTVVGP